MDSSECPVKPTSGEQPGLSCPYIGEVGSCPATSGCSSHSLCLGTSEENSGNSPTSMRISSSIKRTGTDGTWLYPSIEMFKAAMLRKTMAKKETDGISSQLKVEDVNSLDKSTLFAIVHMHNIVNEQAWQHVLKYERLHDCKEPSLSSFCGKPEELTIKARLWKLLGYAPPFDRHDWFVDRCGCSEKPIRYIIDFYEGQKKLSLVEGKEIRVPSIYLDVRPEPTLAGLYDRFRLFIRGLF